MKCLWDLPREWMNYVNLFLTKKEKCLNKCVEHRNWSENNSIFKTICVKCNLRESGVGSRKKWKICKYK